MESSRDSSVWRNLAVTFGGGLALGAVGMKLTQTALRPADAPPRPEPGPVTDRLNVMERRLERMEQTPSSARPAAAPMDQKVLEAVIGAVDARLHEHAGQVDRRLADLEARFAVSQQQERQEAEQIRREAAALRSAIDQDLRVVRDGIARVAGGHADLQDDVQALRAQHPDAGQVDRRLADLDARCALSEQQERQDAEQIRREAAALRSGMEQDLRVVRDGIAQVAGGQADLQDDLHALRTQHEQRFEELRCEYRQEAVKLRGELEQSVETRIVTAAAAMTAAQLEEQLVPLRAEIEQKEKELAVLRQRLADSEKSVLDVVSAIGDVCRQAAERIVSQREPNSAPPSPVAPPSVADAGTEEAAPLLETQPVPRAVAMPLPPQSTPDFPRDANHRTGWRVPLVSSILVSTGYLMLMHYLAAPLQ